MPGAVGRTSTYALCNATLPYVLKLAKLGLKQTLQADQAIERGVNIHAGQVTNKAVAETFNLAFKELKV